LHPHAPERVSCNSVLFNNIYQPPYTLIDKASEATLALITDQIKTEMQHPKSRNTTCSSRISRSSSSRLHDSKPSSYRSKRQNFPIPRNLSFSKTSGTPLSSISKANIPRATMPTRSTLRQKRSLNSPRRTSTRRSPI
jgi:hypothetical protein